MCLTTCGSTAGNKLLPGQPPHVTAPHKVARDGHASRDRTDPDRVQVWCPVLVPRKPAPGLTGCLVVKCRPELDHGVDERPPVGARPPTRNNLACLINDAGRQGRGGQVLILPQLLTRHLRGEERLNNFWFKSFQVVKPFQMQYLEYIFPKMCFKNSYWIGVGMEPFSIPSTPSLQASNSLQSHLAAILKLSSRHCGWRSHRRRSSHLASTLLQL